MSENDFQRLLERLEDAPDPAPRRQTLVMASILVGFAALLVVIPLTMKVLFDPASGLADVAMGGLPFGGLWGIK